MSEQQAPRMPSILLVDDNEDLLRELHDGLSAALGSNGVVIRTWVPTSGEGSPLDVFQTHVDDETVLVVTDYDLTARGNRGLFGPSVVEWCQARAIPVGDFSRGKNPSLPSQANLFELRVPTVPQAAADFVASTYKGFRFIKEELARHPELESTGSLSTVLAQLLERPHLESSFTLYLPRLESANAALLDRVLQTSSGATPSLKAGKSSLLAYVVGHVLVNVILRYPGPLLSAEALCAYLATTFDEAHALHEIFQAALYRGPFGEAGRWYWRTDVDSILEPSIVGLGTKEFASFGSMNGAAAAQLLGRRLSRHGCPRCQGENGGFFCPFTRRPVCERADCSVVASTWIPQGAQLCRVERDFYEEWAPLMGL